MAKPVLGYVKDAYTRLTAKSKAREAALVRGLEKKAKIKPQGNLDRARETLKRQIESKAYTEAYSKKVKADFKERYKKAPSFRKGLSSTVDRLRKTATSQGFDAAARERAIAQRRQLLAQQPRQSFNAFEHRDPIEVYGDDGLTFFDSNKSRGSGGTGSLFGLG